MIVTLDRTDRQILRFLQEDGSLSIADVADKIGMTAPPCWRRVKRLKDSGVLSRQVWLLDQDALGFGVTIFATVKLATHDSEATIAFRDQIGNLPEVLECYILLGSIDVLLKVIVRDIKYYEEFFYNRLSQLPSVREVTSSVVMSTIKNTSVLPIENLRS